MACERLQSVSERRMELVAAESPGAPASASSRAPPPPVAVAPAAYADALGSLRTLGCGFDGSPESERALYWAAALARRASPRLRVVAVHEPVPLVSVSVTAGPPTGTANQVLRRQLHEQLDAAVSALEPGVEASAELSDGSPAHALRERSGELDLLVLGSRGYGPLRAVLLGSVSSGLVRSAESPVVVVPRDAG
jgi:nucleotide-binding universal stress UspA family protein